jgi:hypothetical protein
MKIYYLEDDWRYAAQVKVKLDRLAHERGFQWDLQRIATETAFINLMNDIRIGKKSKPDCFMLDVMVRFSDPCPEDAENQSEEQEIPPYDRAGLRCAALIKEVFPDVPIIFFTILDPEDMVLDLEDSGLQDAYYIAKSNEITPLFALLLKLAGP